MELISVVVFDLRGRTCSTEATRIHGSAQVDVSGLSTGVYVVRATDQEGRISMARFVKQ
ncbi:MAG TPA: T9SS type A sorting domain-containing protein [Flavobacteriales bacterium]|nr:T9SS type A sorting domain-containing protein [Flavobacteriales bacterium]